MFKNAYQSGLLSIFYSCGAKPLELWDVEVKNGHIKRLTDNEVRSIVLEIGGSNVSTTYITCPKGGKTLGITLPYMVMIVKNLKKNFTFEVTVLDETGARRRFRISNFQSKTQILPLCTTMPITLNDGWNQIQFNLAEFTTRSYQTRFMEVAKLKINANIRLRRVYFTEVLLPDDQLPSEYKLYIPLKTTKVTKVKTISEEVKEKENVKPSLSKQDKAEKKETSKVDVTKEGSKATLKTLKRPSDDQTSKNKVEVEKSPEVAPLSENDEVEDATKSEAPTESKEPTQSEPAPVIDSEKEVLEGDEAAEVHTPEGKAAVPVEAVSNEIPPAEIVTAETVAPTEEPVAKTAD